ncbi:MAG: phage portal protein [Gammaproteobacteria bacterium RBG_16_66_13]|nr:MAG: phage portal protein [Gammaproteobacteria bacterium RBG_16_66_13]
MRIPLWTAWRERRAWQLNAATSVLANAGLQIQTASGVSVTEKKALTYIPVLAASRVIAEDVASLPLITYRRLDPRGKERATSHPLYQLLHTQPNPEQDSFMFRSLLQLHAAAWGGGYAEIETQDGWPVALWPIPPWRIEPRRDTRSGELYYHVASPAINEVSQEQGVDLWRWQVFRVFWLSLDGVTPISPVGFAREAIGLGLALAEFGGRFFSNDARPGFILEHPGSLSDDAYKRIRGTFEQRHQGLSRSHRVALLEEGMKLHEVGIPPEDAQFLETRKFQRTDIASLYRMPPHKIGDLERATFTNIEQQAIEYVVDCLRPWLVRWEQAILTQLIPREQRAGIFAEFLVDGLLRGDTPSRYAAYATAINSGWMSRNDVRVLENLNPVDGLDEFLIPLNMVGAGGAPPALPSGRSEQRSVAGRRRLAGAYRDLFIQAAARIVRREKVDVLKLAEAQLGKRNGTSFAEGLDEFFAEHEDFVRREMGPVLLSYAEAVHAEASGDVRAEGGLPPELEVFMAAYLAGFINRWIGSSRGQILSVTGVALAQAGDPVASLADRFTEWLATRPEKTATWETHQAGEAVTSETWRLAGVREKVWSANAGACPLCSELDGQTVEISKFFVGEGQSVEADGAEPLTTDMGIGHPPLHDGCECSLVPG